MGTPVVPAEALSERDSRAIALFGTWMLFGLFLDGWAHSVEKPETFFSPWHGILYSGFVAALIWFGIEGRRRTVVATTDRLATAGLVLFIVGAVGDGAWHELFGIEVDIEALLSPTHVALMIGGTLMVSAPFRTAWRSEAPDSSEPTLRRFVPTLASITLVTCLLLFFLMYLSASGPIAQARFGGETGQGYGVASVLVRTAVLLGASMLVLKRWTPPAGTFTVMYSASAFALAGLQSFRFITLAVPFVVAGVVADTIVATKLSARARSRAIGVAVPLVCWSLYFAAHAAGWGVHWPAEIWTGAIVFAALAGLGLAVVSEGLAPASS